jgi:hypothetical protein
MRLPALIHSYTMLRNAMGQALTGRGAHAARLQASVSVLPATMPAAGHRQISFRPPSGQIRNWLVVYVWYRAHIETECPSRIWQEMVMRSSSSLVAPSAIALLSTALLCSLGGTAMSQITAGPAAQLPSITVDAPKPVARPQRPVVSPQRAARVTNTAASRRPSSSAQTTSPTASAAPDSTLGKIAKLERAASSCNGGCETSVRTGNAPWVGCSYSAGINSAFSSTCTDTLTHKTYAQCLETRLFLGSIPREARWLCSSLQAAGKLAGEKQQVAELKRARRLR